MAARVKTVGFQIIQNVLCVKYTLPLPATTTITALITILKIMLKITSFHILQYFLMSIIGLEKLFLGFQNLANTKQPLKKC